jgi:hypothetical protein
MRTTSGTSLAGSGADGQIVLTFASSGQADLQFGQSGTLTGAGALAGTSALVFGQTGAVTGSGALAGSSALIFGQTGAIAGAGALTGSSALVFGASGTADSGAISGTSAITFAASGTLTATGTLAGSAAMLFDAFGTLDPLTTTQPGPVDSPRSAEGWYRRKRKKKLIQLATESVFISPAETLPQAVIDTVPDFTSLAQRVGEAPAALSARIDREIEYLMREQAERDDEEALVLILTSLED